MQGLGNPISSLWEQIGQLEGPPTSQKRYCGGSGFLRAVAMKISDDIWETFGDYLDIRRKGK